MLIGSLEGSISKMCLQHEYTHVNYRFVKKLITMIKVCLDYSSKQVFWYCQVHWISIVHTKQKDMSIVPNLRQKLVVCYAIKWKDFHPVNIDQSWMIWGETFDGGLRRVHVYRSPLLFIKFLNVTGWKMSV